MKKICPKCNIPMIEEETPVSKAWWCIICGYTEIEPSDEAEIF